MSSLSRAKIIQIEEIKNHPNADLLEITYCEGFPLVIKKGDFQVGDLAIYVPVDLMTSDEPEFHFLPNQRIRGLKLRGILSFGLVLKPRPHHKLGDDVTEELRITKYEPPLSKCAGNYADPPSGEVHYTDIESLRKYNKLFTSGEEIIVTEKIHGENARFLYKDDILHLGTHVRWIQDDGKNTWSSASAKLDLNNKLSKYPNFIFFGELYGHVGSFPYDQPKGQHSVIFFDIFDIANGVFMNYDSIVPIFDELELKSVPVLYRGGWDEERIAPLADGNSVLGEHIKEGFVARPVVERFNDEVGRVILKYHSPAFLMRK